MCCSFRIRPRFQSQRLERLFAAALFFLLVIVVAVSPAQAPAQASDVAASSKAVTGMMVTSDGRTRSYRLYLPSSYESGTPVPLVLVFHGGFGSGEQIARQSGFDDLAEREGFIVVYREGATSPDRGVVPTWNAGDCCGYAQLSDVDDVGFVRELLDRLETEFSIDTGRVYATGMSNGGMMSNRLGCELADRIVAIAPVAGSISIDGCSPARPLSVLLMNGTADESVPYDGGKLARAEAIVPAAEDLAATWSSVNGCSPLPGRSVEGAITELRYDDCADGVTVSLLSLIGMEHNWPGSERAIRTIGEPARVPATELIWSFFSEHQR